MSQRDKKVVPEMVDVFNDLLASSSADSVDQRRLYMLKCQQAQLERQLLILCESMSSRREHVSSLAEATDRLLAFCRECISREDRGPAVMIERARFTALVERCRVVQGTLHKEVEDLLSDRLLLHNLLPSRFSRPKTPLHDLLLSSRGLASLNLARLRKLEGDLAELFSLLSTYSLALERHSGNLMTSGRPTELPPTSLLTHLHAVCKDVSELSLLLPSLPPTPPSLQSQSGRIDIRRHLGDVRSAESRVGIEAALRTLQHEVNVVKRERDALREELNACRAEIASHDRDIEALVSGLRSGYQHFRSDFRDTVLEPLTAIITAYDDMDEKTDSKSLQRLLEACRDNLPVVRTALVTVDGEMAAGDNVVDPLFAEFRQRLLRRRQNDC